MARLVLEDGRVAVWAPGKPRPPGRGASLHADAACAQAAVKTGAFARAFKQRVPEVDPGELLRQVQQALAATLAVKP